MAKILLVDDRPTNRQFLSTLLGYGGHKLLEAGDGAEALRLVREERPDLVISDILMPTMDGFEFAKGVRADPDIAGTKIVFYTATYRATEAALLAKACGVSTVIAKPAEPQRVIDVVNEQLGIAPLRVVPRDVPKPPAGSGGDVDEQGLSHLGVRITDYVNDLRGVKSQLDHLVDRGLELEQERERLRGISTKFAQNLAQLHTTSARLYALIELAMDLCSRRDPVAILKLFCSAARRLLGADAAVAAVLRATEDLAQHVVSDGLDEKASAAIQHLDLDHALIGRVLSGIKVVRATADAGEDSVAGLPAGYPPATSFLGLPIRSLSGCYGVAFFTGRQGGGAAFDEQDEKLAEALGAILAASYENFELFDMLQRHAAELKLEGERRAQSEQGLQRAEAMAKLAHLVSGPDGTFERWSDSLPALLGLDAARLPKTTREWLQRIHPEDRERFRKMSIDAGTRTERAEIEYRMRHADESCVYIRQAVEPMNLLEGAQGRRWFSTLQDVTEQKLAEQRIRRLNRVYAVLSGINNLIVRTKDRNQLFDAACRIAVEKGGFTTAIITELDAEAQKLAHVAHHGAEINKFKRDFSTRPDSPHARAASVRAIRELRAIVDNDIAADPEAGPNRVRAIELGARSMVSLPLVVRGAAQGALVLFASDKDFFDRDEMALLDELAGDISFALDYLDKSAQADFLASYDPLTGLPNRRLFRERLGQMLESNTQPNVAVVVIDINRFAQINDSLGIAAGDAVLREMAARLSRLFTPHGTVARIGGDGFAIALPGAWDAESTQRDDGKYYPAIFSEPMSVSGHELRISGTVGIAFAPPDGRDAETLVNNAEAALKRAKANGDRIALYGPEMNARVKESVALESELRRALERGEFVLHYQPKVDLGTGEVIGLEALIRWRSPERGLVPPASFIPLLEETGLILEVGAWALKRAALDHRGWVEAGLKPPRVAVNVSASQLRQRDFVNVVERAVAEGVVPTGIDLEITESLVMRDIQANIEKLNTACALGMKIAVDDFGTGYSSLAYLARLPVHTLKIDRSFVAALGSGAKATTLVRSMVSLAHSLDLKVVAEGVETEEQAGILRLLRCDEMQGYLFSKPLPLEAITELLKRDSRRPAPAVPA